jgi:hypothetical protein
LTGFRGAGAVPDADILSAAMPDSMRDQIADVPPDARSRALVQTGNVYILYFRDDHAFVYAKQDPRAREISAPSPQPLWTNGDARPEEAWSLKGMGIASIVSMHLWRS